MDITSEIKKPPVIIGLAAGGCALLVLLMHRSTAANPTVTVPAIQSAGGLPGDSVQNPADPNLTSAGEIDPATGEPVWAENLIQTLKNLNPNPNTGPGTNTGPQATTIQPAPSVTPTGDPFQDAFDTFYRGQLTTISLSPADQAAWSAAHTDMATIHAQQAWSAAHTDAALIAYQQAQSQVASAPVYSNALQSYTSRQPTGGGGMGLISSFRQSKKTLRKMGDELARQNAMISAGYMIDLSR